MYRWNANTLFLEKFIGPQFCTHNVSPHKTWIKLCSIFCLYQFPRVSSVLKSNQTHTLMLVESNICKCGAQRVTNCIVKEERPIMQFLVKESTRPTRYVLEEFPEVVDYT